MNGIINFLKPPGMTSSDAVFYVRKRLPRNTPVGHAGTLDPEAAGVLPICIGNATRLFDYMVDKRKAYLGEITFGTETDTQDATGHAVAVSPVTVTEEELRAVLPDFVGEIKQIPPMYSAIQKDGKRLYDYARKGKSVDIEARTVVVRSLEYVDRTAENRFLLRLECGKGLYVRTVMNDIGTALGTKAHLSFLVRTNAGVFGLENAVYPELIPDLEAIQKYLLPSDAGITYMPVIRIPASMRQKIINGVPIKRAWAEGWCPGLNRLYAGEEFAGIVDAGEREAAYKAMLLR